MHHYDLKKRKRSWKKKKRLDLHHCPHWVPGHFWLHVRTW
jgi:hypothetical protein